MLRLLKGSRALHRLPLRLGAMQSTHIQGKDKENMNKLMFDSENKALIFEHFEGVREQKWMVRVGTTFSLLNFFLLVTEFTNPIFGGLNLFSFGACSFIGLGALAGLNVFSKRTIHKLYLTRDGKYVHLVFFNAFWRPKQMTFHISEFQNQTVSYMGFTKVELTSYGYVWLNTTKNADTGVALHEEILAKVLRGQTVSEIETTKRRLRRFE